MRTLLSREVGDAIRAYIVDGSLKPGDALPSEAELAALLDVGKTSVREALRRLEAHGVVEVRRGKGLFVGTFSFGPLIEQLPYGLQADNVPLRQLLQTRRALEEGLISEVAKVDHRGGSASAGRPRRPRCARDADHGRVPADVDQAFHQALFAAARQPFRAATDRRVLDHLPQGRRPHRARSAPTDRRGPRRDRRCPSVR